MRPSLLFPIVLVACEIPEASTDGTGDTGSNPVEEEAGVVAGTIVDTRGAPLAGVEVVADDQLAYDSNLVAVTDADGRYRIELPDLATTWHTTATHAVDYHGQTYHFDLHPLDDTPFPTDGGAVRDFEWRLTGERPDGGTYGAFVVAYAEPGDFSFDLSDVRLTLAPDGPLVDGSAGETITGRLENTPDGDAVTDVALGRYAITAEVRGEPLLIHLRGGGRFEESVTADFEAPYGDLPIYLIEVEIRSP